MQNAIGDAELDRHEASIGRRYATDLLRPKGRLIEGGSLISALDDDVGGKSHVAIIRSLPAGAV
jgi:hypothetical protein